MHTQRRGVEDTNGKAEWALKSRPESQRRKWGQKRLPWLTPADPMYAASPWAVLHFPGDGGQEEESIYQVEDKRGPLPREATHCHEELWSGSPRGSSRSPGVLRTPGTFSAFTLPSHLSAVRGWVKIKQDNLNLFPSRFSSSFFFFAINIKKKNKTWKQE